MVYSPPGSVFSCPAMAGGCPEPLSLPWALGWVCCGGWAGPTALCKGKGAEAMGGRNLRAGGVGGDGTAGLGGISTGTPRWGRETPGPGGTMGLGSSGWGRGTPSWGAQRPPGRDRDRGRAQAAPGGRRGRRPQRARC